MGKILCLDVGRKRVGYAVSDQDETMAFPRGFLPRKPFEKFSEKLRGIVREEGIKKLLLGLPLDEENEETALALEIRTFGEKLARLLILPIFFTDEFGTTKEALAKIPFRRDRKKKEGYADAVAAQIILQRYLDHV